MSRRFDLVEITTQDFGYPNTRRRMLAPRLLGLAGRKRSGKDASAGHICGLAGYTRDAFADDVKVIAHAMFPKVELSAFSDDRKEQPISGMGSTTPRDLAKAVGTGMRELDTDFWVKRVLARVPTRSQTVITDVRFLNEIDAIHAVGGFVIRLNRADRGPVHDFILGVNGGDVCDAIFGESHESCGLPRTSHPCSWTSDRHPSETELPDSGALYDAIITTDSAEATAAQVLSLIQGFRS